MLKQLSSVLMLMSVVGVAWADVTLKIQPEVKVEEINGQTVKQKILGNTTTNYQLNSGVNVIKVSYYEYFDAEHGIGSHDIVRSAPVYIKTPMLQDQQSYTLTLVNPPKNNDQAKAYAKKPEFALYNAKNELLMTQMGNGARRSIVNAILTDEDTNTTQVTPSQPKAVYTQAAKVPQENITTSDNKFNQLISAWGNASKEERKKFMLWLADQTN